MSQFPVPQILFNPHVNDVLFVFFAAQLGLAVLPGPRTQAFLRKPLIAPLIIFAFVMLKNADYTSASTMWTAAVACLGVLVYRHLP
ncbi:hypothetical protein WJX74_009377 [Apatococcus lobatus]|uniref:Uncharacterized protein n=1 Tax=Apatococcus lobatus TaxID=904363 RepID=A0AAW1SEV1_9CHLO